MSTKLLAIGALAAIAGLSACAAEDDTGILPTNPGEDVLTEDVPTRAFAQGPAADTPEGCERVAASSGACSIACFPERVIEEYVPESTCAIFSCELTSGETIQIGGCDALCTMGKSRVAYS